jgi:hypothetical protein
MYNILLKKLKVHPKNKSNMHISRAKLRARDEGPSRHTWLLFLIALKEQVSKKRKTTSYKEYINGKIF